MIPETITSLVLTLMQIIGITPQTIINYTIRLIIVIIAWIFTQKYVIHLADYVKENKDLMKTLRNMGITRRKFNIVKTTIKIGSYILLLFFTLYVFNLTSAIYTMLTAAGVMGIIIGFAVKETASNMISGLIIKINQPFNVGDDIGFLNEYLGDVEKISIYSTTVRANDGTHIIIPNTEMLSERLINYSMTDQRRVEIKVSITPEDDIEKALELMKKAAQEDERYIKEQGTNAFVSEFKDYIIVLELRFWAPTNDYYDALWETQKRLMKKFKKEGIKLAIPMRVNLPPKEINK